MFGNDERMKDAIDAMSEENWTLALKLILDLTKIGVPDAEHFLGWFYDQGIEVEKSNSKAFYWWSKAAVNGVSESQNAIAEMYQDGCGTEINLESAYYWFMVAYNNGDSASLVKAKKIEQYITIERLEELRKKASAQDGKLGKST